MQVLPRRPSNKLSLQCNPSPMPVALTYSSVAFGSSQSEIMEIELSVSTCYMATLSSPPTSHTIGCPTMQWVWDHCQLQILSVAICLISFGVYVISYSSSTWRFLSAWLNGHKCFFQLCWLLSLEWLSYFEHVVQSFCNACFGVRS